jgi:ABC-type uncharacterized transport system permease subunit
MVTGALLATGAAACFVTWITAVHHGRAAGLMFGLMLVKAGMNGDLLSHIIIIITKHIKLR